MDKQSKQSAKSTRSTAQRSTSGTSSKRQANDPRTQSKLQKKHVQPFGCFELSMAHLAELEENERGTVHFLLTSLEAVVLRRYQVLDCLTAAR